MGRLSKSKLRKISIIGVVLLLICMLICTPVFINGYSMYKDAVKEIPITEKVDEIKADEHYVSLDEISPYFIQEIIRTEDHRFYRHPGFDILAILRAAKNDLLAMSFVEGGSTITVQLVKNMYFEFDKVLSRKIAEIFGAVALENVCEKDEILELYLNYINYGEGCFGIKEAAMHYFHTTPMNLTKEQADALVYTIKCPEEFNPNAMAEDAA